MSYDHPIEIVEHGTLVVAVLAADGGYFMWQKGISDDADSQDGIHFEFDGQENGGYNQVRRCTVTRDGIDVVLSDDRLECLCFPPGFDRFNELKDGLNRMYAAQERVLEFDF